MTTRLKRVPPDGGWGWVIVIGIALSALISVPIFQGFSLLFRPLFAEMKMSGTDVTTIVNVNSAFGLMLGFMHGPLIKYLGCRKYAMIGSALSFIGFLLTSTASSFLEFIVYYGVINSIGFGMMTATYTVVMSSYFVEKRSFALGILGSLTGIGPVVMPLVMSKCLEEYSVRGSALIFSGLLLHCFVASIMFQPIKWHYKYVKETVDDRKRELETLKEEEEEEAKEPEKTNHLELYMSTSSVATLDEGPMRFPRKLSELTRSRSQHLSRLSLFESDIYEADSKWWSKESNSPSQVRKLKNLVSRVSEAQSYQKAGEVKWYKRLISMFDLDLLKDPVYRNIWFGMSIAFTAEINFSLLTPMILDDRQFDIEQTAQIMSCIGSADIIFRLVSPFVGETLKISARHMYMISLVMLIVTRFSLVFAATYWQTMTVAAAMGVAKGFRTVYMMLVIPNHVPLEKLPSAGGLQTVLNGLFIFLFGPLVGYIRDASGSYNMVIHICNLFSLTTVVTWSVEMLITRSSKKSEVEMADLNDSA